MVEEKFSKIEKFSLEEKRMQKKLTRKQKKKRLQKEIENIQTDLNLLFDDIIYNYNNEKIPEFEDRFFKIIDRLNDLEKKIDRI